MCTGNGKIDSSLLLIETIENKIEEYKFLRKKEKERVKLESIEREQKERIERDKKIKKENKNFWKKIVNL